MASHSNPTHASTSEASGAPDSMQRLSRVGRGERVYFAAVGVLALWVGIWGYFIPMQVERAIPFSVPPLHARFLGAVYLPPAAARRRTPAHRSISERSSRLIAYPEGVRCRAAIA